MKKIINCETSEVIERELNDKELAQQVIDEKILEAAKKEEENKSSVKRAIFERLNLSEEEAKVLLG